MKVGDSIKITADLTYSGILMPRYESGDDKHLVVKLGNGYNVGINVDEIQKIQVISSSEVKPEKSEERKEDSKLPKIYSFLLEEQLQVRLTTEPELLHLH